MFYILALLSGFFVIASMFINSTLSTNIGKIQSLIVAMAVGLGTSFICFLVSTFFNDSVLEFSSVKFWMLSGGAVYIALTLMFNKTVSSVPAIYTAVIVFISQIFMGNILDYFIYGQISISNILGASLITVGLIINNYIDKAKLELDNISILK